ncbi:MAG: HAD hydrolase-like protein [Oscillospiraceae bacterium]|nr:HAD hydrolase-like protein [Oscillospiraceae bacterium]
MARYQYVLFDFDGTLYNTYEGITKSYQNTLRTVLGEEHEPDDFLCCIGPPLIDTFRVRFGMDDETTERAVAAYRDRYHSKGLYECYMYAGMEDALRRLSDAGCTLAIASSKPSDIIDLTMRHFDTRKYIDMISGLMDDADGSTKTQVIERVIERYGADKRDVVMVGDRFYDAEGAKAAGVDFIAALYGFAPPHEFDPYSAVLCAETPGEIADYILKDL